MLLVVAVTVLGTALLALYVAAVAKVDRRWRRAHLQCCRCLETWHGRAKLCGRCGGRGQVYDWLAVRFAGFPTHDWQGRLDTGPIRVVEPAE